MERTTTVILTNMCMCYTQDKILVMYRRKKDWSGLSFPGGHVEDNESLPDSIVREMKEETNLDIKNPKLCGTIEWDFGVRYIALLYKCNEFEGDIKPSKEGEIFWLDKDHLHDYPFSDDFDKILDIYGKSF